VRDVRDVDLARGRVALEFRDVAEHVQPRVRYRVRVRWC
jgi:hypothetical protein